MCNQYYLTSYVSYSTYSQTYNLVMDRQCYAWDAEANVQSYCNCKECYVADLLHLPFHSQVTTIVEDNSTIHNEDYGRVVLAAKKAEEVLLRLLAYERLQPGKTRRTTNRKIIKHFLLLLSIIMYDTQIVDYNGPKFLCDCTNKKSACNAIKKLVCLCIVSGIDYTPIWSYMDRSPKLFTNVVMF